MAALALVLARGLLIELAAVREVAASQAEGVGALPSGPILVLGGSPERVRVALALDAFATDGRELIASAGAADDLVSLERSCDGPGIRCVTPVPATTRGEARLAARLAEEEGWTALTVVTSGWHAHRAGLHLTACLTIPVRIVLAHDDGSASVPRLVLWHEALGSLDARLRPECRDRTS